MDLVLICPSPPSPPFPSLPLPSPPFPDLIGNAPRPQKQVTAYLEGAAVAQQLEALVERAVERKLREAGLVPPPPPPV